MTVFFRYRAPPFSQVLHPARDPCQLALPLFSSKITAGFTSPAADHIEASLDLNELLVRRPAATFFVRTQGDSMLGAGIHPDDILVVDRSLEAAHGKIIICALNGELTVKRLNHTQGRLTLAAENPAYADILIEPDMEVVVWGVVTSVIHFV
ncbi:MAG: translesion error-prone DNA polymerase V autoproteolytic subunit [Methylobacter sp.]|nr:translesion error-prone DNA polymerase V autoproteolytic subunit [Methylobacter sp.]